MESLRAQNQTTWLDGLAKHIATRRLGAAAIEAGTIADIAVRTQLVAKGRWILILLFACYGIGASLLYALSEFGFIFTPQQTFLVVASCVAVISYNLIFRFFYQNVSQLPFIHRLQVLLDILFVTVLVHTSGGVGSWFWPVYALVMIEAAFLLERRINAFIMCGIATSAYGVLLYCEHAQLIPHVSMPFLSSQIHHDVLYGLQMFFWVAMVNLTATVIGVYLMSVIRGENRKLHESEERLLTFLDSASDLIYCSAPDGKLLYTNLALQRAVGYTFQELQDLTVWDVVSAGEAGQYANEFNQLLAGKPVGRMETHLITREGRQLVVEGSLTCSRRDADAVGIWGIYRDITERKQAEAQLYQMAHHDVLTELPNRALFTDRLFQARAMARRMGTQVAVLYLDLDRFKIINDTLGHPIGDRLLQEVARRLRGAVRETDTVARFGGDEFTIALVNLRDMADAEKVAFKVLSSMQQAVTIDEHELYVTTSIGISFYPQDGEDLDGLVKKADIALYQAKLQGRNNIQYYTPSMDLNTERKLLLSNSLRSAMVRNEFCLFYQPKIQLETGRVTAMEALLRWRHPDFGIVAPGEFLPLAEDMGMLVPLGEWVLAEACRQNLAWQRAGHPPVRVAVNISAGQFRHDGLVASIARILGQVGLEPGWLELEIAEKTIMQDTAHAAQIFREIRDLGVHVSIDDFGSGYSSLAYLKRFSVNTLKIDRQFVRDLEINSEDAAIASAIIAVGASLDLEVIAEGVETEGQLSFLRENRCDEAQGYIFSEPIPAEEVPQFLLNATAQKVTGGGALSDV